jgi:hypothetical protein
VSEGCTESQIIRTHPLGVLKYTDAIVFHLDAGGFVLSPMDGQPAIRCPDSFELSHYLDGYETAPEHMQSPGFRSVDPQSVHLN